MPNAKPKLSLCMIVKNEAQFLPEALAQAANHCDEMIVVDTGSTDASVAIAEQAGARVVPFVWVGDFSQARNFSVAQAHGEWIIALDADERITDVDWEKLKEVISDVRANNHSPLPEYFDLCQINYAFEPQLVGFKTNITPVGGFENYPGFTESWLTRLFRNNGECRFEGVVHEHLCQGGRIVDGAHLPVSIHHHGQALSPERLRAKKTFYLNLGQEKVRKFPDDFKAHHEVGIAYWELGELVQAEQEFLAAKRLRVSDAKNLIALGTVLQLQGRFTAAETVFRELIAMHPEDLFAHQALAGALKVQGRLDEAILALKRQIEINPDFSQARQWLSDIYAERRKLNPHTCPSLTVCYIVKNEADCLGRSLTNVKSHADEIVVLDTGSTDATSEIAKEFGAKVFKTTWHDDFALARNESLKHATSEWILVLDADEVLGDEDWQALQALISQRITPLFFLVQTTYTDASTSLNWQANDIKAPEAAGYSGYFESPLVRLIRNTPQIQFAGAVHEYAQHRDPATQAVMTRIRIHHYGKFRGSERMREKYDLYHRIGVKKIADLPEDPQAYYELAVQRMELGVDDGVEESFLKALELNPDYTNALIAYANYLLKQRRFPKALDYFMQLLKLKPHDPQSYVYVVSLLIEIHKYDLALKMIATARELGGDSNIALLMNEGVIHLHLKNDRAAEACFRKAHALNPDFAPVLVNLGIVLLRMDSMAEAEPFFRRAIEVDAKDASAWQKLGELLFVTDRRQESLKAFLAADGLKPADPDILSQIVTNAYFLEEQGLVGNYEVKLAQLVGQPHGQPALERVLTLYRQQRDEASFRRLTGLLGLISLDNGGAF